MENLIASNTNDTAENSQFLAQTLQFNTNGIQDNENLGFLSEFDSCWEDLTDRLIVSQVKDSVMEGVIHALSQEANDILVAKDLELSALNQLLLEWEMTQEFQEEFYQLIIQGAISDLNDEYGRKTVKSHSFGGGKGTKWTENVKEIFSDLDAVQKAVSSLEQFSSHGSLEFDHLHRKVSLSSSVWENGGPEGDKMNLPEKFDSSNLCHLKVEDLYTYFRGQITKMKREHESTIQAMTEDYFGLKRDFLKEKELLHKRGLFLPSKSKDFDILKKTVPLISLKLKNIIREDTDSSETLDVLRGKLDNLLTENNRQRNMLNDRKQVSYVCHSQASETGQKCAKHSLDEKHFCTTMQDFTTSVENSIVESLVNEEVFKTVVKEMAAQHEIDHEENKLTSVFLQDFFMILCEEALKEERAAIRAEPEDDLLLMTVLMQEITELVIREALLGMEKEIKRLAMTSREKDQLIGNLQSKVANIEEDLRVGIEEKERCIGLLSELEAAVKMKDELLMEHSRNLETFNHQKVHEIEVLKAQLDQALGQINVYKDQHDGLIQTVEHYSRSYLSADRNYRECLEQMNSVAHLIQGLANRLADFEDKTTERIKWNNLRVENSTFQLESLKKKANLLRRTGLLYKERLERRCSDLQKAEAEVDVLGDEVDVLLSLLDKIYIALDHYSPILRHYPGIMEILKLVRKELSGAESAKSVCATP